MERVTITASGCYPAHAIKPRLVEALRASIEQHMQAYGLREITVQSRVLSGDDATGAQARQSDPGDQSCEKS